MCAVEDLNLWPPQRQWDALPTELTAREILTNEVTIKFQRAGSEASSAKISQLYTNNLSEKPYFRYNDSVRSKRNKNIKKFFVVGIMVVFGIVVLNFVFGNNTKPVPHQNIVDTKISQ